MDRPNDNLIEAVLANHGKPEEAKLVTEWFATNDGQEYLSTHMDKNYPIKKSGEEVNKFTEVQMWENIQKRMHAPSHRKIQLLKYAALFIPFLILISFSFYKNKEFKSFQKTEMVDVYVPKGKHIHVTLQDGTSIYLGPDSHLHYPRHFKLNERMISFVGEAYFDVAKNSHWPFLIKIGDLDIKVMGTSFNVMACSKSPEIKVNLDKGKVNMKSNSNGCEVPIRVGECFVYSKLTKTIKQDHQENRGSYYCNWKNGLIVFNDTKLKTVLNVLSLKFNTNFNIRDSSICKFTYTIHLENKSLKSSLNDIESITPIRFYNRGKQTDVCAK